MNDKEVINQIKYMIETFGCRDKGFEKGFVGGLYYAVLLIEKGKQYADKKIDWDEIGREDDDHAFMEKECGC